MLKSRRLTLLFEVVSNLYFGQKPLRFSLNTHIHVCICVQCSQANAFLHKIMLLLITLSGLLFLSVLRYTDEERREDDYPRARRVDENKERETLGVVYI